MKQLPVADPPSSHSYLVGNTEASWNFFRQAIQGASCYKLPRVLQWFSASIGYHHIHHLNPRIPNYRLEKCHSENSVFQAPRQITLWTSLRSLRFRVWDEHTRRMIGLRGLRARVASAVQSAAKPLSCPISP